MISGIDKLQARPWLYGFLPLMRRVGADERNHSIGTAQRPSAEPFRIGQKPSLAFAPCEIASADEKDSRLYIRLFSLGMLGPNGPLPIHLTETAREREESARDRTLVDFFDIFHHRYLTLFYRAWASAQDTVALDRAGPETEHFAHYVASLTGRDTRELAKSVLPVHAQLAASPHFLGEARNADSLRNTLAHYFHVPVAVEQFVFHWMAIDGKDRSLLGKPGAAATMSDGAMLGEQVPDRQHCFRIVIGPIGMNEYLRFTPGGADLPRLVDSVRNFVGYEFEWELELRIHPGSAPAAVVGDLQKLGWSGWLGHASGSASISGMRFQPESYFNPLVKTSPEHANQSAAEMPLHNHNGGKI
ncbi:type VI secretion system protein ImpH [Paraburkholderia sp. GAS199]